jgi:NADPH-dependent curcumin reductase CurA
VLGHVLAHPRHLAYYAGNLNGQLKAAAPNGIDVFFDTALADLQGWVDSGQLKVAEDIIDGLEHTPAALIGLLAGENVGKRMVRV